MTIEGKSSTLSIGLRLLNRSEKARIVFMLVLTLIGVFLETLSLGLVVPDIGFLTKDDPLRDFESLNQILGNPNSKELAVIGLTALSLIYFLKTVCMLWITWIQKTFSVAVNTRIANDMYKTYLFNSYSFYLTNNSANLIRNIQGSAGLMVGTLEPILMILSDALVTFGILAFLIYLEPIASLLTLLVFVISSLAIRKVSRARISIWAK